MCQAVTNGPKSLGFRTLVDLRTGAGGCASEIFGTNSSLESVSSLESSSEFLFVSSELLGSVSSHDSKSSDDDDDAPDEEVSCSDSSSEW